MRFCRFVSLIAWGALALLCLTAAAACDDGGDSTEGPTPTPFSLGSTMTIRGQQVTLPQGVIYVNQAPDCQQEANAFSADCLSDFKILLRGNSYIIFEPSQPRVMARRIEPEDESDFRPLLGLIAGTTGGEPSSTDAAAPTQ